MVPWRPIFYTIIIVKQFVLLIEGFSKKQLTDIFVSLQAFFDVTRGNPPWYTFPLLSNGTFQEAKIRNPHISFVWAIQTVLHARFRGYMSLSLLTRSSASRTTR
jgi:hypothetical protein